jgi:hypothetical protein
VLFVYIATGGSVTIFLVDVALSAKSSFLRKKTVADLACADHPKSFYKAFCYVFVLDCRHLIS